MNLRWLALKILDAIEFEGVFVHDAIDTHTKALELTKQERGFIKKLVFGTIERQLYLDYVINQFSSVTVAKMKPAIRHTLRLSVYQLLYMENIPPSAVCNEAVKLIKKRKMFRLTGFVNGVLRTVIREKDRITLPDEQENPVTYLSVVYAFTEELVAMLMADMGYEATKAFLEASNEEAPLTIRVQKSNGSKEALLEALAKESIDAKPGKWLEDALHIEGYDRVPEIKAFEQGLFQVQDESSMLVALSGVDVATKRVLDVCSAPGGKALHASDILGDEGQVKAYDLTPKKVALIEENLQRLGPKNLSVAVGDATKCNEALVGWADTVIADVPCSGLGIIRKKPDIKWHVSREKIQALTELQRQILSNVKAYVKPGGLLIYSTCTVTRQENDDNVRWFLSENEAFTLEAIEGPYADKDGVVRLMPMKKGPDGFYIAKLRRKSLNPKDLGEEE